MNPHIKKAEDALHFSEYQSRGLTERQIDVAQAQAQATLALAYEQRTAILFAYAATTGQTDAAVHAEVTERLGLA